MDRAVARGIGRGAVALAVTAGVVTLGGPPSSASAPPAHATTSVVADSGCHLGNGVSHVIDLVFDNVHFGRDNPNVPSDLEQMPALLNFLESKGVVFSNSHTPMIGHTADDSLTIYTGLYGDRHGQPVSNSYKTYNPNGTTDPAASFAYWTDPVYDTASTPTAGHDTAPSMVYSPTVPATKNTNLQTPAPWVPFTRAGCNVGDFSTANMVLENTKVDIPHVFGANSPEAQQYNSDADPYKDPEQADYVGIAVHCAQNAAVCAEATDKKFGQSQPSPSAVADTLPTEPGGYSGYQALFGDRYIAPQLGQGTANLSRNGYEITNSAGNLVDLNGQEIDGAFLSTPGFPGFSPTASQTLAYLADMQESGIPVTYGYISDVHERKAGTSGCTTQPSTRSGNPLGPGDSCYLTNTANYNAAFQTFFNRLAADGITPANTEFVISAEENDQFAGANVGRATQPTPAGCTGNPQPCTYTSGQLGELQANITALLTGSPSANTAFDIEPQGASIYVHGRPSSSNAAVRQLQRDTLAMTGNDPYTGVSNEKIVNYQASMLEERVLHMQTADPLRLPTYTVFPKPDYYFSTSGPPVSINSAYAWNHGYYSPNIDVTWAALVGPGVAARGVDGPQPDQSNESHDPNSHNTVPQASTVGTWVDEVDLRPTLLHLVGLTDDYQSDGHVITQALTAPGSVLLATEALAAGYNQINSSVGAFATDTLIADTNAQATGSAQSDAGFTVEQASLSNLVRQRDSAATMIKKLLSQAALGHAPSVGDLSRGLALEQQLLRSAQQLAATHW